MILRNKPYIFSFSYPRGKGSIVIEGRFPASKAWMRKLLKTIRLSWDPEKTLEELICYLELHIQDRKEDLRLLKGEEFNRTAKSIPKMEDNIKFLKEESKRYGIYI